MRKDVSMKKALTLLSLLLLFSVASDCIAASQFEVRSQQSQASVAPLTNKDVVEMVKIGISTDIIIAKIKASPTKFDTSVGAMQELKTASVPDAVILAMVQAPTGTTSAEALGPTGSSDETGEATALVYVYRHKNFSSRNMQPSIYVDSVEVARMDDGKYFIIRLPPGKHSIEINKGHSGAEVDMKAGQRYYFRVELIPGFWKARGQIDFIQKEQGALELKKMKPLEPKWIKDKTRVTTEDVKKSAEGPTIQQTDQAIGIT
jgi:hypothetical protein